MSYLKPLNTTVTTTTQSTYQPHYNNVAIYTKSQPIQALKYDTYGVYTELSSVASDFGGNSSIYAMLQSMLTQEYNVVTGGGKVVICPLINDFVEAKSPKLTSAELAADLTTIQALTSAVLKITYNSTIVEKTFNFSNVQSWDNVVTELKKQIDLKIIDIYIENNKIQFELKTAGAGNTLSIEDGVLTGTGTPLGVLTSTLATDSSGETIVEAFNRTKEIGYYSFTLDAIIEEAQIAAISTTLEAYNATEAYKILYYQAIYSPLQYTTLEAISANKYSRFSANFATILSSIILTATEMSFSRGSNIAVIGNNFITANRLELKNITINEFVKQTDMVEAFNKGMSFFYKYNPTGNKGEYGFKSGLYSENVYLESATSFSANTKAAELVEGTSNVAITEKGMTTIRSNIAEALSPFIDNNALQNVHIESASISTLSDEDRAAGKTPIITVTALTANKVHQINLNISLVK